MNYGCCKDVHLNVKITDAQKTGPSIIVRNATDFKQIYTPVALTIGETVNKIILFDFTFYHAPPFKNKQPVYLMNSIFRI